MDIAGKQKEIQNMRRVQEIYRHPQFQKCVEKNQKAEISRIFCRHDMVHFLDVARLAYIFSMEREYQIPKEEIYAAALLHDIGKWKQYSDGTPHEKASAQIAEGILIETGFVKEERDRILRAILSHRKKGNEFICGEEVGNGIKNKVEEQLAEVLYDADKISRACYACPAEKECNWNDEKKNLNITW